jgi:hypothetical protein
MPSVFKRIKNRALRIILVSLSILLLLAGIVIACISPISKYLIERNSEKYTGRLIDMSWLYVNPFTGHIHAHNLVMHEKDKKGKFLSIDDFSFDVSVRKLLSKTYDFSSVTLDHLWINVVESKKLFNFDDLFKKDSTKPKSIHKQTPQYYVRDIKLINSEVQYSEVSIPVHYSVTKLNVQCPTLQWDSDTASFNYHFHFLENSGIIKGMFSMNFHSNEYHFRTTLSDFDLKSLDQYIKEFSDYGNFQAVLDADLNARGNFNDAKDLLAQGKLDLRNFHFGKSPQEDFLRFSKLTFDIDSLSPLNKKYFFKTVLLDSMYVKYIRYDSLDNFTHMFGDKGKNISRAQSVHATENIIFQLAHYISLLAEDIINSEYRVNQLQLKNAQAVYNDFALQQSFTLSANPILIKANNIDSRAKSMDISLQSKINPFGNLSAHLITDPSNIGNFNLTYNISNVPVPMFNPYTVTYTSYPFDKGIINLSGNWIVINKQITSTNHVLVINPTLADRVKSQDAKKKPMRLIMFLVRELNRKIDVDLPIKGDLNNPKFSLRSEILQVLENIFEKPTAYPFVTISSQIKEAPENFDVLEWPLMQSELNSNQKQTLRGISRYLLFHPSVKVTIQSVYFENKEKEMLVQFEARFYMSSKKSPSLTEDDSIAINKLSIRNPAFCKWLDVQTHAPLIFYAQGKCNLLVGPAKTGQLFSNLISIRKKHVLDFLDDSRGRERFVSAPGKNEVPVSGFSHDNFYYH